MSVEGICAIVTCVMTGGGVLLYIGRNVQTLQVITDNQKTLFATTEEHKRDIVRIDKELAQVKTRQEDCANCP